MILISVMYHDFSFQAIEQIINYNRYFGLSAIQVVHISKNAKPSLAKDIEFGVKDLIEAGLVIINPIRLETFPGSVLPQHIANLDYIVNHTNIKFNYTYIHTSGDLIVRGNPAKHILSKEFGFVAILLEDNAKWPHKNAALKCELFKGLPVYFGRAEGSFFKFDFYTKVLMLLKESNVYDLLCNAGTGWPLEECLFATFAKANGINGKSGTIIRTIEVKVVSSDGYEKSKSLDENAVTINDVENILSSSNQDIMGLKWFSPNKTNSARLYVDGLGNQQCD